MFFFCGVEGVIQVCLVFLIFFGFFFGYVLFFGFWFGDILFVYCLYFFSYFWSFTA